MVAMSVNTNDLTEMLNLRQTLIQEPLAEVDTQLNRLEAEGNHTRSMTWRDHRNNVAGAWGAYKDLGEQKETIRSLTTKGTVMDDAFQAY